ncbi:MAG TPA: hypothetical protein VGX25_04790 [Actinophytocola sp.]|uniref:hypothetical protein n=1 Tax=Actinophytocola sp. TaxID=1872138 RepID=UPI002DDCFB05|nr:hypothetical protein [Actinophytocola sp.]HEV2778699.1 hypothetical protein [Actinophytocola sp.]
MSIATTFQAGKRLTAAQLNLKPYLHALQNTSQNITSSSVITQAVTFDAELVDTINGHSTSSNTSRYTPSVAGYYRCSGIVALAANTTGDRAAQFKKNGSAVDGAPYFSVPAVNGTGFVSTTVFAEAMIFCNGTTDYVELYVGQNSGSTLATQVSSTLTKSYMMIEWMAP